MDPLDADACREINEALQAWRQGDYVVGVQWFVFRTDVARPLTPDGAIAAAEGIDTAEAKVLGFMAVTQICDIVKRWGVILVTICSSGLSCG